MHIRELFKKFIESELVLYSTSVRAPDASQTSQKAIGITGWKSELVINLFWIEWRKLVSFKNGLFKMYNSPGYFGIGFDYNFILPGYDHMVYDGINMYAIYIGNFRINWTR